MVSPERELSISREFGLAWETTACYVSTEASSSPAKGMPVCGWRGCWMLKTRSVPMVIRSKRHVPVDLRGPNVLAALERRGSL